MRENDTMMVTVMHQPRYGHETRISLDRSIIGSDDELRQYLEARYGPGELIDDPDRHGRQYVRRMPGPNVFWQLLSGLLNKSHT